MWVANVEELAKHYNVYMFDLPLFGNSSRHCISFGTNADVTEQYFVSAMHQVRAWLKFGFLLLI
jgi:pimeloyl-ACP methyl ester carboxylesterase